MKILLLLKSDCGNLALVNLYRELCRRELTPDVCSVTFRANDMRCFEGIPIAKFEDVNIQDYDVLIAVRNIFEYPLPVAEILRYRGLIVADNTTLYEGDDVYGDLVFTSGRNNYDTLAGNGLTFPTVSAGCLKVLPDNLGQSAAKKFVWIESGHFPYGRKGREQEAELIRQICLAYPDYQLVVKPRYLLADCSDAKHSNGDHLYYYLEPIAREVGNLVLLNEHRDLGEVLADAQCAIHTYSSAFQEAVLLDKGVINVCDIETEETIDLRRKRFGRIREYIDRAGCSRSRTEVLAKLPNGDRCTEDYRRYILGSREEPAAAMVDDICLAYRAWQAGKMLLPQFYNSVAPEDFTEKTDETVCRQRVLGAIHHIIAQYEYQFDDYELFAPRERDAFAKADWWAWLADAGAQVDDLHRAIRQVIRQNFDVLNQSEWNQPHLMKLAFEEEKFDPEHGWENLLCQEAFAYFAGKFWLQRGETVKAGQCFADYLQREEGRLYPRTYIDKKECVEEVRRIAAGISKLL